MTKHFYISASGAMATQWLSEVLSAGTKIKCFHGPTGLGRMHGRKHVALDDVFKELQLIAKNSRTPYIGVTHLPMHHGVSARRKCIDHDFPFFALCRNPILATESLFQAQSERVTGQKLDKLSGQIRDIWGKHFTGSTGKTIDEFSFNELIFLRYADNALRHLIEVEVNGVACFKFEEYTTDYEQISSMMSLVTGGNVVDDHNVLEKFQSLGKKNTHRTKNKNATFEEVWSSIWSDTQRLIFSTIRSHFYSPIHENAKVESWHKLYPEIDHLFD